MSQIILDEVREGQKLLLAELDRFCSSCLELILETGSDL